MKKTLKIFWISGLIFFLLTIGQNVYANSINKISMDIYVDYNGDAHITEIWDCYANEGTEVYHPYYNLGNSEIKNLTVREGNANYITLYNWNTSGTLASKANKCGINRISDGVELCWGISNYGSHRYIVEYTITNFVSELTDAQMIYWTLIPYEFSNSIGQVYIKIHTNFKIPDTIDVWGYGNYGGTAYVYNGYIEMQSDGNLSTDEYMTVLVKFPKGTFNARNKLNNDFNYYYNMAEEGSKKYTNLFDALGIMTIPAIIFILLIASPFIIFFLSPFISIINAIRRTYKIKGAKIKKNVPYFRDIPCKKDIFRAYYISHQYGLTRNKTDVLGAIILKWLKDGLIRIEQKEKGHIFKKDNTVVVLKENNLEILSDEKEKELFKMLYEASKDGYLENKEFENWCSNSYSIVLSWFDKIIAREKQKLINEELIKVNKVGIFKQKEYVATQRLNEEAMQLSGLKRYLNEYTLIKDREAIEVHLFEEYLIFAQILGIAKKVAKEFKDLYPEIIEQSNFTSYDNIVFIHMCSSSGISQANAAKSRAESYSSGGGGFSSGGGGGGSFGGGGGGGGFR